MEKSIKSISKNNPAITENIYSSIYSWSIYSLFIVGMAEHNGELKEALVEPLCNRWSW